MRLEERINYFYYTRKDNIPLPGVIMIEPNNVCNLQCSICCTQKYIKDRCFLSPSDFRSIIDQFPKIRELIFCGTGEPLLNKDIFDMINIAKRRGIPFISLVTNGKLLHEDILGKIINSGIDRIQISVHSFNPEIFAKMRNEAPSNLKTLEENINKIVVIKKNLGAKIKICCNAVITKFNFNGLLEFVKEARDLGADRIDFIQLSTYGNLIEDINAPLSCMPRLAKEARKLARKLNIEIGFLNGNEYGRCYQLWDFIMVHADGNISPCNGIFPADNIEVGNIFREPIKKIWGSDKYHRLRQLVRKGELENCKYCESGYCMEGKDLRWFKNYYLRPLKRSFKNLFNKIRIQ